MNYDRFSKLEFEKKGHSTDAAHDLAVQLGKEVQVELYELIKPRMHEIAAALTARGHDLTNDTEHYPECICFREVGEEKGRIPGLILAVDIVITAGFPLTLSHEELRKMEEEEKLRS
jgi:hypothetical protein